MSHSEPCFLDREPELAAFEARLEGREKRPALLFYAPEGMGKTCVLCRLRELCLEAKTACALVDFQHDGLYTAEAIVRSLGKQIGPDLLEVIETEIDAFEEEFAAEPAGEEPLAERRGAEAPAGPAESGTPPGGSPLLGTHITTTVGDVGAGAIVIAGAGIRDVNIYHYESPAPEEEPRWRQRQRMSRLNGVFWELLEQKAAREPMVLLFDACEYAKKDALDWLQKELLARLLEGDLPSLANLAIVLAGDATKKRIWLDSILGWGEGVDARELDGLPPPAVRKYWIEIRGLAEDTLPAFCRTLRTPPSKMIWMANQMAVAAEV